MLKNVLNGKLSLKGKRPYLQVDTQYIESNYKENSSSKKIIDEGKNSAQNFCISVLPPVPVQPVKKPPGSDPFQLVKSFPVKIKSLLSIKEKLYDPPFRFDISLESAEFNFKLTHYQRLNL